jgi:hypothetical protein
VCKLVSVEKSDTVEPTAGPVSTGQIGAADTRRGPTAEATDEVGYRLAMIEKQIALEGLPEYIKACHESAVKKMAMEQELRITSRS